MSAVSALDLQELESWSIDGDRDKFLERLVPGSDKWYYFKELLSEQTGYPQDSEDAIEAFLAARKADRRIPNESQRFEWRRAFKKFAGSDSTKPSELSEEDVKFIQRLVSKLPVQLHHARALPRHADDSVDSTPSVLDLSKWDDASRLAELGSRLVGQLDSAQRPVLEDSAIWDKLHGDASHKDLLYWLVATQGVPRHLPSADKVKLVEEILKAEPKPQHGTGVDRNKGSGSNFNESQVVPLFRDLTLDELRSLNSRGKVPVSTNQHFLKALLARIGPEEGVDFAVDHQAHVAYLDAVMHELSTLQLAPVNLPLLFTLYYNRLQLALAMTGRVTGGLPGSTLTEYVSVADVLKHSSCKAGTLGLDKIAQPDEGVFGSKDFFHFLCMPCNMHINRAFHEELGKKAGRHESDVMVRNSQSQQQMLFAASSVNATSGRELIEKALKELLSAPGCEIPPQLTKFIDQAPLARMHAEAQLLAGSNDASLVAAAGGESVVTALRDSTALEFAPHNPEVYDVTDAVSLAVWVKNIPRLTVSVFEVNTTAYYKEKGAEISTSIDLDGLIPNDTHTIDIDTPPIQRKLHHLPIAALSNPATARRGVFVVELVGGGFSTRAVIRKGALRFVTRETAAGQAFRVLDELNAPVGPLSALSLWIGGRSYTPRDDGEIMVPFAESTRAGQSVIMTLQESSGDAASEAWSFSSLGRFNHFAEAYEMSCSWFVEQEALVRDNRKATVALRPRLQQNASGQAVPLTLPLSLLQDVRVTVESTDGDGVSSSKDFTDVQLQEGEESTITVAVPNNLRQLRLTLHASITKAITGGKQHMSCQHVLPVNGMDASSRMHGVYLRYVRGGEPAAQSSAAAQEAKQCSPQDAEDGSGGWRLYVLGKSGEPLSGMRLHCSFEHPVWPAKTTTLSTNAAGWVTLGNVHDHGYTSVSVTDQSGFSERTPTRTYPLAPPSAPVHTFFDNYETFEGSGEVLAIPFSTRAKRCVQPFALTKLTLTTPHASLMSAPSGRWSYFGGFASGYAVHSDFTASAQYDSSSSAIKVAELPAGVYQLTLFNDAGSPHHVRINVLNASAAECIRTGASTEQAASGAGDERAGAQAITALPAKNIVSSGLAFKKSTSDPVRLVTFYREGDSFKVLVAGGRKRELRVHITASQFVPTRQLLDGMGTEGCDALAIGGASAEGALRSQYVKARKLGEEHRYILERSARTVQAGNTLPRPSLLLNPWAVGKTQTDTQDAADGTSYESRASAGAVGRSASHRSRSRAPGGVGGRGGSAGGFGDLQLDFLAAPARTHFNLKPDSQGMVSVPVGDLCTDATGHVVLTIVAADSVSSSATFDSLMPREITTSAVNASTYKAVEDAAQWTRPMSLEYPLDTSQHYIQQKSISVLQAGEAASITAASDTKIEEYATLGRVARLFSGLTGNMGGGSAAAASELNGEWAWLTKWASLSDGEKRTKYSKYSCHELNLFLFNKDRVFFDAVVRPYLANKRAKSFMDRYVLQEDLSYYATQAGYATLNAAEQALLLARLAGVGFGAGDGDGDESSRRSAAVAAAAGKPHAYLMAMKALDAAAAQPTSSEVWELVFASAISANALEDDDKMHEMADRIKAESKRVERLQPSMEKYSAQAELMADMPMPSMASMAAPMAPQRSFAKSAMAAPMPQRFASRGKAKKSAAMSMRRQAVELDSSDASEEDDGEEECYGAALSADLADRERVASQAYRSLDKTEEFAETHYWKVKSAQDTRGIVKFSEFWADFALHRATHGEPLDAAGQPRSDYQPFLSKHFPLAARSLNEMLLALAVVDLPFVNSDPSDVEIAEGRIQYTSKAAPLVLFHKDLRATDAPSTTTVLVGQNFFDPQDRHRIVKGQAVDKYLVGGEFLRHKVYGVQCVITNVSSGSQELDILLQIPQGSVPLAGGFVMRSFHERLGPYSTTRKEYLFYFPALGDFAHYPVHVAAEEQLVAAAVPTRVRVVSKPTIVDTESWEYVSQQGSMDDVLHYLRTQPLARCDLGKIAWRCGEEGDWRSIVATLSAQGHYDGTLWGYALKHKDVPGMRQWLKLTAGRGGVPLQQHFQPTFSSALMTVAAEPWVAEQAGEADFFVSPHGSGGAYEHLEYSPLVNARAHQLGAQRKIMNRQQSSQWRRLLEVLAHKAPADITVSDRLAIVYHMLLQDRVEDAQRHFKNIEPTQVPGSVAATVLSGSASSGAAASGAGVTGAAGAVGTQTLMFDYMAAYLDFFNVEQQPVATAVAQAYKEYPVPKWQRKFAIVAQQLAEAQSSGEAAAAGGKADEDAADDKELAREKHASALMAAGPSLDLAVDSNELRLSWSNLEKAALRFYLMDIELLFSTSAFVTAQASASGAGGSGEPTSIGQFAFVRPNAVMPVSLTDGALASSGQREKAVPVPEEYRSRNVLVECVAGGIHRTVPYFSNNMRVQVVENAGRVSVRDSKTGTPLPCVYVKVYSRRAAGDNKGKFYKDGYTDLRGVFDYASLSTDELSHVQRFALLVKSDSHGAVIRTARPPAGTGST